MSLVVSESLVVVDSDLAVESAVSPVDDELEEGEICVSSPLTPPLPKTPTSKKRLCLDAEDEGVFDNEESPKKQKDAPSSEYVEVLVQL
jgi:hypothetical protein